MPLTFDEINEYLGMKIIKNGVATMVCSCMASRQFANSLYRAFGAHCHKCGKLWDMHAIVDAAKLGTQPPGTAGDKSTQLEAPFVSSAGIEMPQFPRRIFL